MPAIGAGPSGSPLRGSGQAGDSWYSVTTTPCSSDEDDTEAAGDGDGQD